MPARLEYDDDDVYPTMEDMINCPVEMSTETITGKWPGDDMERDHGGQDHGHRHD
jgi:hypothetical protein